MIKKALLTCAAFAFFGVFVFGVAWAGSSGVTLPETITAETLCPVAGCTQTDGACHAAASAPEPDGSFEMACPQVSCSESECHAWDRIVSASKPSDASMNLWIIAPVVLVLGLVLLAKKVR